MIIQINRSSWFFTQHLNSFKIIVWWQIILIKSISNSALDEYSSRDAGIPIKFLIEILSTASWKKFYKISVVIYN